MIMHGQNTKDEQQLRRVRLPVCLINWMIPIKPLLIDSDLAARDSNAWDSPDGRQSN